MRLLKGKGWWVLLVAMVALNVWLLWPRSPAGARIPYSVFVEQVRAGNVRRLRIGGETISGQFVRPVAASTLGAKGGLVGAFHTTFPAMVGDPRLLETLDAHDVLIEVDAPSSPWLALLLVNALPIALLAFALARAQAGGGPSPGRADHGLCRGGARRPVATRVKVTFDDVAGAEEAKRDLQEIADFALPAQVPRMGRASPHGAPGGPPGTGSLARAVSGEASVPFFTSTPPSSWRSLSAWGPRACATSSNRPSRPPRPSLSTSWTPSATRREGAWATSPTSASNPEPAPRGDGRQDRHEVIVMAATTGPTSWTAPPAPGGSPPGDRQAPRPPGRVAI